MIEQSFISLTYWVIACLLGVASILVALLCVQKKKKNTVTMVSYIKNENQPNTDRRSRSSTNGTHQSENQVDPRLSQHSMPNENRILPDIPKGTVQNHGTPPSPQRSTTGTPGAVSLDGNQHGTNWSPKKSRRLPALPPAETPGGQEEEPVNKRTSKEIDDTYEDLRDEDIGQLCPPPSDEVVGSGDSGLYAKVENNALEKQQDDNDLYAQVGSVTNGAKESAESSPLVTEETPEAQPSEDDQLLLDSPTAVTYASVDKMKKTISIRSKPATQSHGPPPPPPIPERNFDDDGEEGPFLSSDDVLPPSPILVTESLSTRAPPSDSPGSPPPTDNRDTEESGPAYDTLSVRESFAHQRLRQIVEDEQRNRYVNTNAANAGSAGQRDVYAQIEDEVPEAVYESVSAPGSADGTVGITGRNLPLRNGIRNEDSSYVNVNIIPAHGTSTPPSSIGLVSSHSEPPYEDINLR